ncbi:MAG TPA: nucleotidyltransferase domain-containing protein [Clostridia bacterium]|nr:nucleotidyltransferase domain-containing protein [Clostridia bacterium]
MISEKFSRQHRQIAAKCRELDLKRKKEATARAKAVSELLKRKYGASSVILYGSFAEGGYHDHSDIDLLVYDFKGPYWEMYSEAEQIAAPFKVSVVCSEDASPSLIEHVREKGVTL